MPPRSGNGGYPPPPGPRPGEGREVIFEFSPIGASVKVTAVDVATGIEVVVIGPAAATQHELERIAVQKLRYRLGKENGTPHETEPPKGGGSGGGIIV